MEEKPHFVSCSCPEYHHSYIAKDNTGRVWVWNFATKSWDESYECYIGIKDGVPFDTQRVLAPHPEA